MWPGEVQPTARMFLAAHWIFVDQPSGTLGQLHLTKRFEYVWIVMDIDIELYAWLLDMIRMDTGSLMATLRGE